MNKATETPFHKILMAQGKLDMYVTHGEAALGGQTPQEFAADVQECFEHLMAFRNIVNGMVSFKSPPRVAVLPYLGDEA